MKDSGSIKIEGIVSDFRKNGEKDLEIFLKVDSFSGLPELKSKDNFDLINCIKSINFVTYPILDDEKMPNLYKNMRIKAGIPFSKDLLQKKSFELDGSLINYLIVTQKDGEKEYYFPLEM